MYDKIHYKLKKKNKKKKKKKKVSWLGSGSKGNAIKPMLLPLESLRGWLGLVLPQWPACLLAGRALQWPSLSLSIW